MKALLFDVGTYERSVLDKMNENELYGLAMSSDLYYTTMVFTLDEFQEMINDDAYNMSSYWLYFVNK